MKKLISECCGAPVVGMVDVTLHPALCVNKGKIVDGKIVDTIADVRRYVESTSASDKSEAYCASCGEPVNPWKLAGVPDPRPEWEQR